MAQINVAPTPLINQGDSDPQLRVDPSSITHAFIALAHTDMSQVDKFKEYIEYFMNVFWPSLWMWGNIKAKFVTVSVSLIEDSDLNIDEVGPALESHGLTSPYSIVFGINTVGHRDGGTTKMLIGFAYYDIEPKLFLARKDGCIQA